MEKGAETSQPLLETRADVAEHHSCLQTREPASGSQHAPHLGYLSSRFWRRHHLPASLLGRDSLSVSSSQSGGGSPRRPPAGSRVSRHL